MTETDEIKQILGVIMEWQNILKEYLTRFGKKGDHAVSSELTQLHYMEIFAPVVASKLSKKDIAESFEYLMFLINKMYGIIKLQICSAG